MYLDIIPATKLPISRAQIFTYSVPSFITKQLRVGQVVEIPLHARKVYGVVESIKKTRPKFKTKPILALHEDNVFLEKYQLDFAKQLADYFLVSLGLIIKLMIPEKSGTRAGKEKKLNYALEIEPISSAEQEIIKAITGNKKDYLLKSNHPENINLGLIKHYLKRNKQVLLLLPEIQRSAGLVDFYKNSFAPDEVVLWHSHLSRGKLYQNWLSTKSDQAKLIIGTRSAIFMPFSNLGLIIMDSENDSSFKQWDQDPRYHARQACLYLARATKAKLVYTSNVVSLELLHQVKNEILAFIEVPVKKQEVEIINMQDEKKGGNFSLLANKTTEVLQNISDNKARAVIYSNRYGSSGVTTCKDCGHTIRCEHCRVPLVYHQENNLLICHYCNLQISSPALCPQCQGPNLKSFAPGLDKINSEISKAFPRIKTTIVRAGQDNETKLENFRNNKAQVLLGTQYIIKKHLPKMPEYAIIINPDSIINLPDYQANEKALAIIDKVARLGKKCLIQTNQPDHPVLQTLLNNNYKQFYSQELKNRKELGFPPFCNIVKLIYKHKSEVIATEQADKLYKFLLKLKSPEFVIYPPSFSVPAVIHNKFNVFLNLKLFDQNIKEKLKKIIPSDWMIDVQPESLM